VLFHFSPLGPKAGRQSGGLVRARCKCTLHVLQLRGAKGLYHDDKNSDTVIEKHSSSVGHAAYYANLIVHSGTPALYLPDVQWATLSLSLAHSAAQCSVHSTEEDAASVTIFSAQCSVPSTEEDAAPVTTNDNRVRAGTASYQEKE
jgi:hypothetical protein